MLKKIDLQDAVGTRLAHDITEIRPGEFKGAAFRKGHTVCNEDICHLQKLGKNHLYVIDLAEDEIHENEAAAISANERGRETERSPFRGPNRMFCESVFSWIIIVSNVIAAPGSTGIPFRKKMTRAIAAAPRDKARRPRAESTTEKK
jgi:hypothetical protein